MKGILFFAAILFSTAVFAVSLSDYPSFFANKQLFIVVGDTAPASDVAAAVTVMNSLAAKGVVQQSVGVAKLASEIGDLQQQNLIVVGSPCHNPVAAELMGNPEPCEEAVPEGKAMLKLYQHPQGTLSLLITARNTEDVRLLARRLADNGNNFAGFDYISDAEVHLPLLTPNSKPRTQQVCIDSDGGVDSFKQGTASLVVNGKVVRTEDDYCSEVGDIVVVNEALCSNNDIATVTRGCENGCIKGACSDVKIYEEEHSKSAEQCGGCIVSETCVPIGIRLIDNNGEVYCSVAKSLAFQQQNGEQCQNNFECRSNTCTNGVCTDFEQRIQGIEQELQEQKSILQRIIEFISNIFG